MNNDTSNILHVPLFQNIIKYGYRTIIKNSCNSYYRGSVDTWKFLSKWGCKMVRKKFTADIESTTNPDDCRIWLWGMMEIGNQSNYHHGTDTDTFMNKMIDSHADIYFHNLKFDGVFIVDWLLKNGWKHDDHGDKKPFTFNVLISNMGQWYSIEIIKGYRKGIGKVHTTIYDSLKKLPFKVKEIAHSFKLNVLKGDINYEMERPVGYIPTDDEYEYLYNDLKIVADALEIQFEQGLIKMTAGSDSLAGFKTSITDKKFKKLFPVYSQELNERVRRAYKGGFTWFNHKKYKGKTVGEGLVYDVNSLYPFVMYEKLLPYGTPEYFTGEYQHNEQFPLFIQHITCKFYLKPDKIPTIQIKKDIRFKGNEYLETSKDEIVDLYLTNIDMQLLKEHYDLEDLEYHDGYMFKAKTGMFKDFIDKWTYIKQNSEGAIKLLAKLQLNSLYGKFATNTDVTGKVPYLKENGAVGLRTGERKERKPIYTPLGAFITSYARELTIRTAQSCFDRIIYCDTDSIHLEGLETPKEIEHIIDDKKLGYWAHESTFWRGKYIRQKTYIIEEIVKDKVEIKDGKTIMNNTKLKVVCAGMPDNIKEKIKFDDFEIGYTSMGKLVPEKVSGGVVLRDTAFTLKG